MAHDADQQHDLRLAHRVQQTLLPGSHPRLPHFDLLAWNQPAQRTGGDYYDWFERPDGRFAIALADATGHGVSAALSIVAFRAYVRAVLIQADDFARQIARINDFLVDDLIDGRFVTALIGILCPRTRRLALHAAGHGPLFFVRSQSGLLERWDADGVPLGVLKFDASPTIREVDFGPGDLLLALTDGFLDRPGIRGPGLDTLARLVEEHHGLALHDLVAMLHGHVLEVTGDAEQHDDLTALALRCVA